MISEQHRIRVADVDDKTIGQMHLLRKQGLSLRRIGAEVGFSHGYVGRILKSHGIGEPPKLLKPASPRRTAKRANCIARLPARLETEAKGLTIIEAWQDYAKGCNQPYTYPHFSTLYKGVALRA